MHENANAFHLAVNFGYEQYFLSLLIRLLLILYSYVIAPYIGIKICQQTVRTDEKKKINVCIFISVYIDKMVLAGIEQMCGFPFNVEMYFYFIHSPTRIPIYDSVQSLKCTDIIIK